MKNKILLFLLIIHSLLHFSIEEACSEARSKCPSDANTESDEEEYPPFFVVTGPNTGNEDEAVIFNVQLGEVYRYGELRFYIGIALDAQIDLYSVGNMRVVGKGKNYECVENGMLDTSAMNLSESGLTEYMGSLYLGIVVNCGNAEDIDHEDNILTFELAIYVMQNALKSFPELEFCIGADVALSVAVNCPKISILPRQNHPEVSQSLTLEKNRDL